MITKIKMNAIFKNLKNKRYILGIHKSNENILIYKDGANYYSVLESDFIRNYEQDYDYVVEYYPTFIDLSLKIDFNEYIFVDYMNYMTIINKGGK